MKKRKTRKIIVYIMLFAMLASTLLAGAATFL
ncbi:stressosome-associated protein Prli42 [Bacillus sp. B15-48]|nr:stressosome-associated protein Prli42 [Bacillus sp. B15-48]MBM4762217.1 stressosome-associated protein Prli42 [Bacillus sp. B15-48]